MVSILLWKPSVMPLLRVKRHMVGRPSRRCEFHKGERPITSTGFAKSADLLGREVADIFLLYSRKLDAQHRVDRHEFEAEGFVQCHAQQAGDVSDGSGRDKFSTLSGNLSKPKSAASILVWDRSARSTSQS